MDFCKITAIIEPDRLEFVETKLLELNVGGFNKMTVSGIGEYKNCFNTESVSKHIHLEIYLQEQRASEVIEGIMEAAHTGNEGDGIVVLSPVNEIYRIRTREKCNEEESC
jgi:nitrogen regulatory protein P-II 1